MSDVNTSKKIVRTMSGEVVSAKADKTITVLVKRQVRHPLYGKVMRRSTKLHAHDESNQCQAGDIVTVRECRPYSKSKTWMLVSVDERAS